MGTISTDKHMEKRYKNIYKKYTQRNPENIYKKNGIRENFFWKFNWFSSAKTEIRLTFECFSHYYENR